MSPEDLARLELAKRAYEATQPRALEIQTGVRRARLRLGRPKTRRNWLSRGLVLVVLALGSLAYAKPQALAELVRGAVEPNVTSTSKHGGAGRAIAPLPTEQTPAPRPDTPTTSASASAPAPAPAASQAEAKRSQAPVKKAAKPTASAAVSEWGRVGQALARGDESSAMGALEQLGQSAEQSTRDKADLGRAQLLMARGDTEEACALGRSLTTRGVSGGIERQAQALLKTCIR